MTIKKDAIAKPQTALEIQAAFYAKTMEIWKDEKSIHEMFAKDLSEIEFKYFVSLGLLFGANPFAGEIWAVKYDKSKPASIFLGRNFKRRKAQELEEYDGHYSAAVYSKDKFKVVNGVPDHEYANGDRGVLERAYCLVYRKGITRPFYKEVKFNEYNKGFSTWKGMPETMIVKVAENQCLTMAFQGTFQGTYDESEEWKEKNPENVELNGKMEVSTEEVQDHDKTGFEQANIESEPEKVKPEPEEEKPNIDDPKTKTDTIITIEDAIKEVNEQITDEGVAEVWSKHPLLHKDASFQKAVMQIRANIESAQAQEAHEDGEQQVIDDERKKTDDGRQNGLFEQPKK